jgi:hypothetical protein
MKRAGITLFAALIVAAAATASAQDGSGPEAKITIYYSPAKTVLKAEAMTFSPEFDITGNYFAVMFEAPLKYKRFGVAGSWLQGRSKDLPGAKDFITSGFDFAFYDTFNPLTDELIKRLTVNLTYTVLDHRNHKGNIDVTAGHFLLESQPGISKGNTFGGFSMGVQGGYDWLVNGRELTVNAMTSYVPTFFVHGNVEGQFTQDYIVEYRTGVEYEIAKHLALTAGYQGMYLKGRVTDETLGFAQFVLGRPASNAAIVTAAGFYFGGVIKFGGR